MHTHACVYGVRICVRVCVHVHVWGEGSEGGKKERGRREGEMSEKCVYVCMHVGGGGGRE